MSVSLSSSSPFLEPQPLQGGLRSFNHSESGRQPRSLDPKSIRQRIGLPISVEPVSVLRYQDTTHRHIYPIPITTHSINSNNVTYSKRYCEKGFDKAGYNIKGYDRDGYDRGGYNINGYDRNGYDEEGYNENGYDEEGYNRQGFSRYGFTVDKRSPPDSPLLFEPVES